MAEPIESLEFRRLARANCYKYGCLRIYMDKGISLDKHNFPNYSVSGNSSNMEQFLSLMQGLGTAIGSNDPLAKLSKTLPVVKWDNDDVSLAFSLNGTMYFLDYQDYRTTKKSLKSMLVAQGWSVTEKGPITSYVPTMQGSSTLYADDPIDAAGRAMMLNAMQHTTAELEVLEGYMTRDADKFASGMARKEGRAMAEKEDLAGYGILQNLKAGYEAYSANTAGGIMHNWQISGYPIEMIVNGESIRSSVNGILTSAEFTESAFIIDESGQSYPTEMEVNLSISNLYGALLSTMSVKN